MQKRFCDRCEAVIERDYFGVTVCNYGYVSAAGAGSPSDIIVLKSDLCASCYQKACEVLILVPAERTA